MQTSEHPRKASGFLFAIGLVVAIVAVWAAVALASGSSSGSTSSPSSPAPAAVFGGGAPVADVQGGPRGDCPDEGGGSTTPSTPSTPSTQTTTVDGSTSPSL